MVAAVSSSFSSASLSHILFGREEASFSPARFFYLDHISFRDTRSIHIPTGCEVFCIVCVFECLYWERACSLASSWRPRRTSVRVVRRRRPQYADCFCRRRMGWVPLSDNVRYRKCRPPLSSSQLSILPVWGVKPALLNASRFLVG